MAITYVYYWINTRSTWNASDYEGDKQTGTDIYKAWSLTSGGSSYNGYPASLSSQATFDRGSGTCDTVVARTIGAVKLTGWTGGFIFTGALSSPDWTIQSDASYISGTYRALCTDTCVLGGAASKLPSWLDFGTNTTLKVQKSGVGLGGSHGGAMIVVDATVETLHLTVDLTAKNIRIGSVDGAEFPVENVTTNDFALTLTERVPEIVVPDAPTGVTATATGVDTITVKWDVAQNASSYWLYCRVQGSTEWVLRGGGTPPYMYLGGLLPSTTYEFYVLALSKSGGRANSVVVQATTKTPVVAPAVPTEVVAIGVATHDIAWEWVLPDDATGSIVQYRKQGEDWSPEIASPVNNYATIGLLPGMTYEFRVRTVRGNDLSDWSGIVSATTLEAEPLPHVLSLEERIQRYWEETFPLESRISVKRLSTGPTTRTERPFLNLIRGESKAVLPSNFYDSPHEIAFRLELHHDSFETGTDLAELVRTQLDRARLSIEGEPATLLLLTQSKYRCESENHWVFVLEFRALTSGCC